MNKFITNFYPRIKDSLVAINKIESLVERSWVWINEQGEHEKYLFLRDNVLLISKQGDVTKCKWQFLSFANSIIIDTPEKTLLFNQGYLFDGLLLLKKDGLGNNLLVMLDEAIIPDYDIETYINNKLKAQKQITPQSTYRIENYHEKQSMDDIEFNSYLDNKGKSILVEKLSYRSVDQEAIVVDLNRNPMQDGLYEIPELNLSIDVFHGRVSEYYYINKCQLDEIPCFIHQFDSNIISVGDMIRSENGLAVKDGKYRINYFTKVIVRNGKVAKKITTIF